MNPFKVTADQKRQYAEQGYFVTEPAFSDADLAGVLSEFNRLWQASIKDAEAKGLPKQLELARLRPFIGQVHEKSATCERFIRHPAYLELCQELIGPDADLYYNQAVLKPPSKGKSFGWHQDSQYIITDPLEYITCWTPISRATVDNGTIWVVPGTHTQGLIKHDWSNEGNEWMARMDTSWKIPVVLRPGQIAVFTSLLPHASGPNISDETRAAYVVQFHKPGAVVKDSGKPAGDHYPVLRNGQPVRPG